MANPNIKIIDCLTGEETVRPMIDAEYEQLLKDQEAAEAGE
jgi:hypothetical protein